MSRCKLQRTSPSVETENPFVVARVTGVTAFINGQWQRLHMTPTPVLPPRRPGSTKAEPMTRFLKSDLFRNFSIGFSAGLLLVVASQMPAFSHFLGA